MFVDGAKLVVKNVKKYYENGDESVLPRSIATKKAFENAMSLDIAMGGSSNTILHLLTPISQCVIYELEEAEACASASKFGYLKF